jgi:MoaD family protein
MQITIKYRAQLAALAKITNESIEAKNIKDVLRHIKKQFGAESEKLAKTMLIVVNGQSILMLKHFNTILKNGDEVSFLPICGGG